MEKQCWRLGLFQRIRGYGVWYIILGLKRTQSDDLVAAAVHLFVWVSVEVFEMGLGLEPLTHLRILLKQTPGQADFLFRPHLWPDNKPHIHILELPQASDAMNSTVKAEGPRPPRHRLQEPQN